MTTPVSIAAATTADTSFVELPDWLSPTDLAVEPTPALQSQRRKLTKELQEATFNAMFERVLDEIIRGRTLKSILVSDVRPVDYAAFSAWINRNPQRRERYKEAKELRTEWWAGRVIEIAEGDELADVQRDKLRIDTYKWLMGADNRRTYGDTKQVEINQSISVLSALDAARARAGVTIDMPDSPQLTHNIEDIDD